MAAFYIKTADGLVKVSGSGSVTAQSIIDALGYVPADNDDVFGLVWNDDKTQLTIKDKNNNIICTFDANGFNVDVIDTDNITVSDSITTDSLTANSINCTSVHASAGFTGNLTGDVKGNLDGNAKTATSANNAGTAVNLSTNPSLAAENDQITVTAGGKTSAAFTVPYATAAGSATNAEFANAAGSLSTTPELKASGNNITVTAGGKTSAAFTVPYATAAGSATNATNATALSTAPSLSADGNNITVTAGGKTSAAFTVPYATAAGSATTANTVTDVISDASGITSTATKPTTGKAVYTFVNNSISASFAANDAMIFKGTLGTGGTVTALPATHNCGWTYRVITAGTYAGVKCEVGDLIICITDGTTANNAHWTVAQTNIDGAVIGPASSSAGIIATFADASGKVISSSNKTINDFATSTHKHEFTGSAGTTTSISGTQTVASSSHTHGYTPAGDVTINASHSNGVLTITASFAGSAGTTTSISGTQTVASSSHTHGYTPAGSIGSPTA